MTGLAGSWLTVAAAAASARRSVRTVERWIADGRLPAVEVGGTRYVNELAALHVERDTRRASQGGRPGARPPVDQLAEALGLAPEIRLVLAASRSGVVLSLEAGLCPAPNRSP